MSIWGKILGGVSGLAIGGPIGALIGVGVGAALDAGIDAVGPSPEERRQISFTIGVIALSAKMAKADGRVTQEEVLAFKQVFKVPDAETANVGRVFDRARQSTAGFQQYASQLAMLLAGAPHMLEDLLEALFYIAEADGHVHPKELDFLAEVARIFGFSEVEWEMMAARHVGPDAQSPYTILGVTAAISEQDLKAHHRKLVKEYHPDRLIAEGVPHEFIAVATERLAAINAAYDQIVTGRKSTQKSRA